MSATATSAPTTEDTLRRLLRHEAFRQLRWRSERFRPLEAFGIAHRELSFSAFLATLLDPRRPHGLRDRFLRDFISLAAGSPSIRTGISPLPLSQELAIDPDRVRVDRERHRIDVLIDCLPNGPVIGVEVKVWAAEQNLQIARYQTDLRTYYGSRQGLIVFLTLDGRRPKTDGGSDMEVPCVCMSWKDVAGLLDKLLDSIENTAAEPFVRAFSERLKEMTVGTEEKKLARALFKKREFVELFRTIEAVRPRFYDQDVLDELKGCGERVLQDVFGDVDVDAEYNNSKDDAQLAFRVSGWKEKGFYPVITDGLERAENF